MLYLSQESDFRSLIKYVLEWRITTRSMSSFLCLIFHFDDTSFLSILHLIMVYNLKLKLSFSFFYTICRCLIIIALKIWISLTKLSPTTATSAAAFKTSSKTFQTLSEGLKLFHSEKIWCNLHEFGKTVSIISCLIEKFILFNKVL